MPRWTPGHLLLVIATACAPSDRGAASTEDTPNVVNIVARGLTFEAPDSIPSGWTTFRFANESEMIHFAILERLPEGITIKEQQEAVAPVFQEGLRLLSAGQVDAALSAFGTLPEWFGNIVFSGGPGLTSPGYTSQTTVRLTPGRYLIECYVKTAGVFHSYNPDPAAYGMVRELIVTDMVSDLAEPSATVRVTLSAARGIEVAGDPVVGQQTIAVYFEDQIVHENFVGHDLHLARLTDSTDLDGLAKWMDWSQPNGLQTPAPVEFLGGADDMAAGNTEYFTVTLEPGRYAWISEVTNPDQKGMLKPFTVGMGGN
jgi:hypothetical protein